MPLEKWDDKRLDPRQRPVLKTIGSMYGKSKVRGDKETTSSWDELTKPNSRQQAAQAMMNNVFGGVGSTSMAPTDGLLIEEGTFNNTADENRPTPYLFMRPNSVKTGEVLPCVYYIHGGGMATLSCFYSFYQQWMRTIAHQGVCVFAIEFRNCYMPNRNPRIAPFPAGLNDCMSGLEYLHAHASAFHVDASRIIVAGESGGGNLSIATALKCKMENKLHLLSGLYALCPYIAGHYPQESLPSTSENNGILINVDAMPKHLYGIDAYNRQDPLAWPLFATTHDLQGLPRTFLSLNECDPLRDEGVQFYRNCLEAKVPVQCRMLMGTAHAVELLGTCPDISLETAQSIAAFAKARPYVRRRSRL